ncbi:g4423 [Coccomyxa viridis]|uniref:G4423 protein n=1 Tax=Coccomyxa viridis TaxID=1274662 RepID=A0ABP1FT04_9CHLO
MGCRKRKKETWMDLLRCLSSQPQAAAQATAVSLGAYHSVALMAQKQGDLQLYAFGRGFHGQLGNASYGDCAAPTKCSGKDGKNFLSGKNGRAAVVAAGSNHNLLITRRGEIFAWGLSSSGELGQRDTPIDQAWPVQVQNVGPAFRMRMLSVSAGGSHSLAICENGELWACGRGRHGQLGFGNFDDATTLRPITSLRGVRIVAAAAGEKHSLALATHGAVYAWGCGRCGQLGVPEISAFQAANPGVQPAMHTPQFVRELDPTQLQPWDRITSIAAGLNHNAAMSVAGEIYMWGSNKHGCLGLGDTSNRVLPTKVNLLQQNAPLKKALQAACGAHRWRGPRYNGFGQLGTGDSLDCKRFTAVPGLGSVTTACIVSGENHACAIAKTGELYFWGRGDSGQLGAGNDFSQRVPQKLVGYQVAHPEHTLRSPSSRAPSA